MSPRRRPMPRRDRRPFSTCKPRNGLLLRAFSEIPEPNPRGSALKGKMRLLGPTLTDTDYGCTTFRALLTRLAHRVTITDDTGTDITVSLLPERQGDPPPDP
jgi:hypothetical protein